MLQSIAVLSALTLVATPVPKLKSQPFYPAKVGTTWVYQDGKEEETLVVSAVEIKSAETFVTLVQVVKGGRTVPREKVVVTEKGLFRIGIGYMTFDAPLCLAQFPLKAGAEWEANVSGPAPIRREKGSAKFIGFDKVTVPAGSYRALRVEMNSSTANGTRLGTTTFWFASGVGLVKMMYPGDHERVLKSFTPGKD